MKYIVEKRVVEGMKVNTYIYEDGSIAYDLDDAMEILLRRLKKDEKENEGKKKRIAGTEESEADNSDI